MSTFRHAAILAATAVAAAPVGCGRAENPDSNGIRNEVEEPPAAATPAAAMGRDMPPAEASAIAAAIRKATAADGGLSGDARWVAATTDLDGDGSSEALAYVIDRGWCGSGGCPLYVLDQGDKGWTVADKIGPSQLPIYRLDPGPDGWSELGVTIGGGGAERAVMSVGHSAKGYAANPTVVPAKATVDGVEPLLPDREGTPLPAE